MKKIKEFWAKSPLVRLLSATLLMSVGVYLSFPEKGFLATLPLNFLFYLASSLLLCDWRFSLVFPPVIAFLFGRAALLPDPFLYAAFSFLTAAAAFLAAFFFLRTKAKKIFSVLAVLFSILGLFVPLCYSSTPFAWRASYKEVEKYLSEHYPDQEFCDVKMHYDLCSDSYRTLVLYEYETGVLTSTLTFGKDGVDDGFFEDTTRWMTEKRKTDLIRTFQKNSASVITETFRVLSSEDLSLLKGSYGTVDESVIPYMHYSVTLREEKPERREFAEECARLLAALQKDGIRFGKITFYGLDAGRTVHRLEVLYDTLAEPDSLLSNVVNA